MLQQLIDIRNAVEHEDAEPPDDETCQMFLEFTWYFLRSTDGIVQKIVDSILFEQEDGGYWVEIDVDPPDRWIPKVRGWLPPKLISTEPENDWMPLKVERHETRAEAIMKLKEGENPNLESYGWGKKDEDIHFVAEIRGSSALLKRIYKLYFELAWQ